MLYRIVDVEGFVCYQQNYYSVPWRFIGQPLPLRITEDEVIVYSPAVVEIARQRIQAAFNTRQVLLPPKPGPNPIPAGKPSVTLDWEGEFFLLLDFLQMKNFLDDLIDEIGTNVAFISAKLLREA